MLRHFIALKTFGHQIDCFCPGGEHADKIIIHKGDIIEVTKERNFIDGNGWYFLIGINDQSFFYMAIDELELYCKNERLVSMLDIDLRINYLQFKINQSLDSGDKASFVKYTNKLKEENDCKVKLNQYIHSSSV